MLRQAFVLMAAAGLLLATIVPANAQTFWPNRGSLYYDGYYFADSYFVWDDPGGFDIDTGYEHDLAFDPDYFAHCESVTNLPNGYDDCPTAGVLESGDWWVFSFGSYWAENIVAGEWYWGEWYFSEEGPLPATDWELSSQEVFHDNCPWDGIWCMAGTGRPSELLMWGTFWWGSAGYWPWDYCHWPGC